MFKDRIPTEDAEVVRRLKAAGAVLLGKQNLHEFAYGGSSMVSYFRRSAKRLEPRTHHRRVFGRLSHGGRRRTGFRRDRHRHRRLGSRTGRAVRRGRPEANLWTGQRPGRDPAFSFPRSRGADRADGRGRGSYFCRPLPASMRMTDKASVDVPVEDYVAATGQKR